MEWYRGEPKNSTLPKLRVADVPVPGKRRAGRICRAGWRPLPRIADLIMTHVVGTPSEKLAWLRQQRGEGKLDADDPDEIAEAEVLLIMLARLSGSRARREKWRHLDELLDEGLKETFPASDPVSVGHFTSTEPPAQPIDRGLVDLTGRGEQRRRTTQPRRSRARDNRGDCHEQAHHLGSGSAAHVSGDCARK
jgi:hypothetical protein